MAAKSQSRLSAKSSKSGGSSQSLSAKADGKGSRKKVTMEDDDGEDKDAMAYKILSANHTNQLMPLTAVQIQDKLKEIFSQDNYNVDLTQAGVLDYYTSAVYWGIQQKFTAQQLSGFFTIIHTLLDNVKEKHMGLVENSNELKKMFVGIGLDDVKANGLDFFNLQESKLITEYIYSSFFQHYKLYLFMFTHAQAEEIIGTDLEVEVAKAADVPFPPPLDEGVSEDVYRDYIATPPPTPSPELKQGGSKPGSRMSRVATPKSGSSTPRVKSSVGKSKGSSRASSRSASRTSSRKKMVPEEEKPDPSKELEDQVSQSNLFAELTPEDVREVVKSVTKEMIDSLQVEMASKIRLKENDIIQRINKIHKVAD